MDRDIKKAYDETLESRLGSETELILGSWTSIDWLYDPKHLVFNLSRYKFVAKMLEGRKNVIEIGCGDGFGIPTVAQGVENVYAVDWEPKLIDGNRKRMKQWENINFICNDMNNSPLPGDIKASAIYSIDFIEHIDPQKEDMVMKNMIRSYECRENAIMIIGTPNITAKEYASPVSKKLHINLKSHVSLRELLGKYFHNVFMFGMNDEVLHTGYAPMCHYLWGIGAGLK